MANRDGHKVRVILEDMGCKPEVICPHIGKEYNSNMLCAETVDGKVTGCYVDTSMKDISWELFQDRKTYEIKKAPFDIEWYITGSFEDSELWVSVIEDDNNTEYSRI